MHDDTRNGGGAGYGAAREAEGGLPRPAPAAAVPPMEAEWLRVVSRGQAPAAAADGDRAPGWQGNGRPAGGVDTTRDGH